MRRSSRNILLLFSPLLLFWLFCLPSFLMARVPKTGRVVDSATGEGIGGATIIASAVSHRCGGLIEARCASDSEYRVLAHTDANGRYWIRPTLGGFWPLFPTLGERREEWHIAVIKPGFAVVGDHVSWTLLDDNGMPRLFPPSAGAVPAARSLVVLALVEPIRMYHVDLDLKQSAIYMSGLLYNDGIDPEESARPAEVALRREIFTPLLASVCAEPKETTFDYGTFAAIARLAPDVSAFDLKASAIDPSMRTELRRDHRYNAAAVCEEMKAGNPS